MKKVELIIDKSEIKNNTELINNLYGNCSARVIYGGVDDGVYYVTNFPKDEIVLTDDTTNVKVSDLNNLYNCNFNKISVIKKKLDNIYIVKPADTIEKIANVLSIDAQELIKKNNLRSTKLFVGQRLFVNT
ncbi:MAG: LysM peptidoglycan-binding domain-containing protein [Clostridiales bacterium]|nr:LysM peptidoglycan-binding domain-containing protein [Clostridiales bacterium]